MDAGVFFVVHVWRDARGFHASARDVSREDEVEFRDAEALASFFAAAAAPVIDVSPPSRSSDEGEAKR